MLNEQQLINKIKVYNNFIDVDKLKKAYEFAESAHATQKRHSGDPYISHPIAVANILAELRLDGPTITTALLHDTIEDTNITYQDVETKFGKEIADLVDGVTKLSKLENQGKEITLGENFRKLILATAKDIRVLLVKLADRLHNMRTISSISSDEKRIRIAKETMEIYSPLAERLGMHSIRDELEDLAFNVLNTEARSMIVDRIEKIAPNTQILFEEISNDILSLLSVNKVFGKITGREKTPFSIWRKIQSKRVSLEQITDLIGFRIILDSVDDCYKVLGIFHQKWKMIPGRFKDYISTPKSNNYRSLHTTVIGPKNQRMEIQIRTSKMQDFAERGIASHWIYKDNEKFDQSTLRSYNGLQDLVELLESGENPEHYLEYTKLQLFQDQVFCFTPKGAVVRLPSNATPIDFAYAVHSDVGDTCIGVKINGKESPLQTTLTNGDQVEIVTSNKKSPSMHWLSFAKTGKARAAIRKYWHDKMPVNKESKIHKSSIWVLLSHKAGTLGEICSLIGKNKCNIFNVELVDKKEDFLSFIFDIEIKNLKDFTNLISELKLRSLNFKIIRNRKKS
ncbi:MAG: bifunctional (p)ppGpp synthetase/guanosine-3',5'-bis(diphosphate) 3'-pyrophosphohydrolase [Proteobacteria bacterium]|jgi:guanosine-3',5'-bis(diphosphate) 3'-pyrophosphohydrolase|nr:bifunctional (p)ppGpp synthetase/guanosine-3',5'-bis(diphosphate) 3'-pyrophosphohydrolase [Pseudomonadota bacterium]